MSQTPTAPYLDRINDLSEKLRDTKETICCGRMRQSSEVFLASQLYTTYCAAVGGMAWNGEPLPEWELFSTDPSKTEQANAWVIVAVAAKVAQVFAPVEDFKLDSTPFDAVSDNERRRSEIAQTCEALSNSERKSRSRSLAITKLEEAGMWIAKDLQDLNAVVYYEAAKEACTPR